MSTVMCVCLCVCVFFLCQAEDGIRDLVRSRGLGDVYKRQGQVDLTGWVEIRDEVAEGAAADRGRGEGCAGYDLSLIHI